MSIERALQADAVRSERDKPTLFNKPTDRDMDALPMRGTCQKCRTDYDMKLMKECPTCGPETEHRDSTAGNSSERKP